MSVIGADTVKGYLNATLSRLDFAYTWENGFASITVGIGVRRWKTAILCLDDRLVLYAAYPGRISHDGKAKMLEFLNTINANSACGGYFLLEAAKGLIPVCRCDVLIPDEYSIPECIENGLKFITAEIYSKWEKLHEAMRQIN